MALLMENDEVWHDEVEKAREHEECVSEQLSVTAFTRNI